MTRHQFDPLAFTFGLLFVLIAVAGLTGPWPLHELELAWVGPGLLILLGLVVLLTAVGSRPRAGDELSDGHRAPAGDGEDPATTHEDPATTHEDPATTHEDPAAPTDPNA